MTIESRHLRYFVAVAEERNFTRAAARLHMAQPPLSAQIRQLEQRVGATLLDRRPGDVSLTPAGEALLEAAYESLAALEDGMAAVRAIADGRRGRVRLALGPTAPLPPALAALGRLRDHAPGLQVEVTRASDADGLVARGRADVAMVWAPLRTQALWSAAVHSDRWTAVLPAGHPSGRGDWVNVAELSPELVLELEDARLGVGRTAGSLEELLARVAAGQAVGVVPAALAAPLPPRTAAVPLRGVMPASVVVAHPGERASAAALFVADALLDCLRARRPDAAAA